MDATLKTQAPHKATTPSGDSQGEEAPLSPDELRKLDAYWRASNYLVGRADLPARQPAPEGAAQAGAHQAAAARPLGHVAGPEHALRAPQPGHQAG